MTPQPIALGPPNVQRATPRPRAWWPARMKQTLVGSGWALASLLCLGRAAATPPETYRVAPGDSLSVIAQRHSTSVAALCHANGLERTQVIRIGQELVLPSGGQRDRASPKPAPASTKAKTAPPGEGKERRERAAEAGDKGPSKPTWAAYTKTPARHGYLELESVVGSWSGQALKGSWEIPESARVGIARVLASWRTGEEERIHGRLIRLLVRVSNAFGGRKIRIVSGYRGRAPHQHTRHSKHALGRAIDFSIPGVPNEVLRDYLLHTFSEVGVGYYPNSTHVHLDIRERSAYWVDYSRPGQPPRYEPEPKPLPQSELARPSGQLNRTNQNASPRRSAAPERQRSRPAQTSAREAVAAEHDEPAATEPSQQDAAKASGDEPADETIAGAEDTG